MFGANEENDEFFSPQPNTHLASLFGQEGGTLPTQTSNLTYTAPKQPKSTPSEPPREAPKSKASVLCCKLVDAYKFVDTSYAPVGKCGLALIGNADLNSFDIILYRNKQEVITRSRLPTLNLTLQNNSYAAFCDDQRERWCVRFETDAELDSFQHEIVIRGGSVVDGAKKAPNSPKLTKLIIPSTSSEQHPASAKAEADTTDTRASILSRMAKVGQALLLPTAHGEKSMESDSTSGVDEERVSKRPVRRKCKPIADSSISDSVAAANSLIPTSSNFMLYNQYMSNVPLLNQLPSHANDHFNVLVAENRTHNCEIRMNLSQISAKLDKVLNTVERSPIAGSSKDEARIEALQNELKNTQKELQQCKNAIEELRTNKQLLEMGHNESMSRLEATRDQLFNENHIFKSATKEMEREIASLKQPHANYSHQRESESEAYLETINELNQKLENRKLRLDFLEQFYEENKNIKRSLDEANWEIKSMEAQLKDYEMKSMGFGDKLKDCMNLLFQQIMSNFEGEMFDATQIRRVLAHNIKQGTFNIIKEFDLDFKGVDETDPQNNV